MKKIFGIVVCLMFTNLIAKPITDVKGTKELCGKAAMEFGKGNYKESFNLTKPYSVVPSEELDNAAYQTENALKRLSSRFGKPIGSEFLKTEVAGSSVLKHTYIGKFENTAARYMCIFYKAEDKWNLQGVSWDDKLFLLFR